ELGGGGDLARQAAHGGLREQEHRHHEHAAADEQDRLESRLVAARRACAGADHAAPGLSTSRPSSQGRSAAWITTERAACWWFASRVAYVRGSATPEALSVCGYSTFAPASRRKRMPMRRAWKSSKFEHELHSSHVCWPGDQTSKS